MNKTTLILILVLLASALALAQATAPANVAGKWDLTVTTPRGERLSTMDIVQDGEKLKITLTNPGGEVTGEGTITGNEIEFTVTRTTPRGQMVSNYKGKVEGDTMSGDVQLGSMGSAPWKAVRKKA